MILYVNIFCFSNLIGILFRFVPQSTLYSMLQMFRSYIFTYSTACSIYVVVSEWFGSAGFGIIYRIDMS